MIEAVYGLPRQGKTARMMAVQQSLTGKMVMCERCQGRPASTATYDDHGRVVAVCKACLQESRTIEPYKQGLTNHRRDTFMVNPFFQPRRNFHV